MTMDEIQEYNRQRAEEIGAGVLDKHFDDAMRITGESGNLIARHNKQES